MEVTVKPDEEEIEDNQKSNVAAITQSVRNLAQHARLSTRTSFFDRLMGARENVNNDRKQRIRIY